MMLDIPPPTTRTRIAALNQQRRLRPSIVKDNSVSSTVTGTSTASSRSASSFCVLSSPQQHDSGQPLCSSTVDSSQQQSCKSPRTSLSLSQSADFEYNGESIDSKNSMMIESPLPRRPESAKTDLASSSQQSTSNKVSPRGASRFSAVLTGSPASNRSIFLGLHRRKSLDRGRFDGLVKQNSIQMIFGPPSSVIEPQQSCSNEQNSQSNGDSVSTSLSTSFKDKDDQCMQRRKHELTREKSDIGETAITLSPESVGSVRHQKNFLRRRSCDAVLSSSFNSNENCSESSFRTPSPRISKKSLVTLDSDDNAKGLCSKNTLSNTMDLLTDANESYNLRTTASLGSARGEKSFNMSLFELVTTPTTSDYEIDEENQYNDDRNNDKSLNNPHRQRARDLLRSFSSDNKKFSSCPSFKQGKLSRLSSLPEDQLLKQSDDGNDESYFCRQRASSDDGLLMQKQYFSKDDSHRHAYQSHYTDVNFSCGKAKPTSNFSSNRPSDASGTIPNHKDEKRSRRSTNKLTIFGSKNNSSSSVNTLGESSERSSLRIRKSKSRNEVLSSAPQSSLMEISHSNNWKNSQPKNQPPSALYVKPTINRDNSSDGIGCIGSQNFLYIEKDQSISFKRAQESKAIDTKLNQPINSGCSSLMNDDNALIIHDERSLDNSAPKNCNHLTTLSSNCCGSTRSNLSNSRRGHPRHKQYHSKTTYKEQIQRHREPNTHSSVRSLHSCPRDRMFRVEHGASSAVSVDTSHGGDAFSPRRALSAKSLPLTYGNYRGMSSKSNSSSISSGSDELRKRLKYQKASNSNTSMQSLQRRSAQSINCLAADCVTTDSFEKSDKLRRSNSDIGQFGTNLFSPRRQMGMLPSLRGDGIMKDTMASSTSIMFYKKKKSQNKETTDQKSETIGRGGLLKGFRDLLRSKNET